MEILRTGCADILCVFETIDEEDFVEQRRERQRLIR